MALLLQAIGLLVLIALTVPSYIESRIHPLVCTGWCLDLQGLTFYLSVIIFGPVAVMLLLLGWRWRGLRLWPLAVVAVIDVAAIWWTATVVIPFVHTRVDTVPSVASAPPLLLLPGLATLALGTNLVRPVPWRPILAASAAGCLLLASFLWLHAIRPVHQRIPGEIPLPFSRIAVYEGRDLGCRDYVAGWTHQHQCMRATLLIYRGSGDPSSDQATINHALLAQKRIQPGKERVAQLPLDMAVNRTDGPEVDPSNTDLCLIITDRVAAAPSKPWNPHCGWPADYADIRSHWPADDAYAIGIIYYSSRPDYRGQPSITFLNAPVSARPAQTVTLKVRTSANTACSVAVVDESGPSSAQGLDPKTSDAAGNVVWTWSVGTGTLPGQWPITVACGSASGQTFWWVQ